MVNKQILIGFLGSEPETVTFTNGNSITKFSVATSEKWIDKTTGEKKEHTEWHNIVTQGNVAEICAKYLKKGSKVYLEGKTRHRSYESDGVKKYITEVNAREVTFLSSVSDSSGEAQNQAKGIEPEDDLPF